MLVLGACSSKPEPVKPPPVQAVLQSPGRKAITVTAVNTGAAVMLDPSQELIVRLEVDVNNAGEWMLTDRQPSLFSVTGPRLERVTRGATGDVDLLVSTWRFVPTSVGTLTLNFELRAPRSRTNASQTVSYVVTVK